jgi:glucose/mannose-6-phosphate isomerase
VVREVEAMLEILNEQATVERLDPHGLLGRIEALPEQCEQAWRRAADFRLTPEYSEAREVVVLGMGGSAIAGDILRSLASVYGWKPVHVARGYDAPSFIGEGALVVACSQSGNTEETLSAFRQALSAGARLVVLTTGGSLRKLAQEHDVPVLLYEYDGEPRSGLGNQLMALLALSERVGLLPEQGASVAEAIAVMRELRPQLRFSSPTESNPAKQVAGRLHRRLPVVIGAGVLSEAAYRWKTQINENSKCWAVREELPELNHNSIAGFGLSEEAISRLHVVLLWHGALHPRLLLRYEATAEALAEAGVSHERLEVQGTSPLAQVLSAVYVGDFVSYYLALLNGMEPSPVEALDRLKARLAAVSE